MTSISFPSAVQFIPVSKTFSTFRLEVQVPGSGHGPALIQLYELEYLRNGDKWIMEVKHYTDGAYWVIIRAPETVQDFTHRQYKRTGDNIHYMKRDDSLNGGLQLASFFIGAEITVAGETPTTVSASPWNFASSDQMQNWDVVLSIGGSKFYAHKAVLSLLSTTFQTTFNGAFREKNQQEVPVNVEGINAQHFEAFLQCLYPCGREPKGEFLVPLAELADYYHVKPVMEKCVDLAARLSDVSKLDKFRIAVKTHSTALEDEVISTLNKDDIGELLASDIKSHLNDARWEKLMARSLSLQFRCSFRPRKLSDDQCTFSLISYFPV